MVMGLAVVLTLREVAAAGPVVLVLRDGVVVSTAGVVVRGFDFCADVLCAVVRKVILRGVVLGKVIVVGTVEVSLDTLFV